MAQVRRGKIIYRIILHIKIFERLKKIFQIVAIDCSKTIKHTQLLLDCVQSNEHAQSMLRTLEIKYMITLLYIAGY